MKRNQQDLKLTRERKRNKNLDLIMFQKKILCKTMKIPGVKKYIK